MKKYFGVFVVFVFAAVGFSDSVIIDDKQAVMVGNWTPAMRGVKQYGDNFVHDRNSEKGKKSVWYPCSLVGRCEVSIWHPIVPNGAINVPVDIVYVGGTNTILVNQRFGGSFWKPLGVWTNVIGVRIRNTGTTNYVLADAVRFENLSYVFR